MIELRSIIMFHSLKWDLIEIPLGYLIWNHGHLKIKANWVTLVVLAKNLIQKIS